VREGFILPLFSPLVWCVLPPFTAAVRSRNPASADRSISASSAGLCRFILSVPGVGLGFTPYLFLLLAVTPFVPEVGANGLSAAFSIHAKLNIRSLLQGHVPSNLWPDLCFLLQTPVFFFPRQVGRPGNVPVPKIARCPRVGELLFWRRQSFALNQAIICVPFRRPSRR